MPAWPQLLLDMYGGALLTSNQLAARTVAQRLAALTTAKLESYLAAFYERLLLVREALALAAYI